MPSSLEADGHLYILVLQHTHIKDFLIICEESSSEVLLLPGCLYADERAGQLVCVCDFNQMPKGPAKCDFNQMPK